jgi:hypothetical protein
MACHLRNLEIARLASGDFHPARLVASNFVRSAEFGAKTIGGQRNHVIILSGNPKHGFVQSLPGTLLGSS